MILLFLYLFFNTFVFFLSYKKVKNKKGRQVAYKLIPLGIFEWADALIISPFWIIVSAVSIFLNDPILFGLLFSLFWLIRSIGEAIYYFNQQFSRIKRQDAKELPGYKFIKDEYITWYLYQVFCQCIAVFSLFFSILFSYLWLKNLI